VVSIPTRLDASRLLPSDASRLLPDIIHSSPRADPPPSPQLEDVAKNTVANTESAIAKGNYGGAISDVASGVETEIADTEKDVSADETLVENDAAGIVKVTFYTLVPVRPRRRGERRSLRTFAGASLRPHLAFNTRPRRLSTPPDAFQLHPDIRSYTRAERHRRRRKDRRRHRVRRGVARLRRGVHAQARSIQKCFTHRPVSTLDRLPFQLTDELFLYGTTLSSWTGGWL